MDTSKVYIKMCDCDEIQGKWKPDEHDYFVRRSKDYSLVHPVLIRYKSYYVWLPRQDQIQKILLSDKDLKWNIPKLVGNFIPFFGSNKNYERFNSMEQLWLAFYMYEKHKKKWNGEKWAKQ